MINNGEHSAIDDDLPEEVLVRIEKANVAGISSQAILDALDQTRFRISEATLRKWVQLGLLPRSVRVGRKGKHQGSQGMYPVAVIRQIKRIKEMMAQGFTIDEIQREFLFARSDIEEVERCLERVIDGLEKAVADRTGPIVARNLQKQVDEVRRAAEDVVARLTHIEHGLTTQARLRRHAI